MLEWLWQYYRSKFSVEEEGTNSSSRRYLGAQIIPEVGCICIEAHIIPGSVVFAWELILYQGSVAFGSSYYPRGFVSDPFLCPKIKLISRVEALPLVSKVSSETSRIIGVVILTILPAKKSCNSP